MTKYDRSKSQAIINVFFAIGVKNIGSFTFGGNQGVIITPVPEIRVNSVGHYFQGFLEKFVSFWSLHTHIVLLHIVEFIIH